MFDPAQFCQRLGSVVGVMAADIEHFKRVNGMLGHEAGDEALRGIAAELAHCVREEDIARRAGGEEFIVILPGIGGQALYLRAEAVRSGIEKARIRTGAGTMQLTVSIGLATCPANGETEAVLLRAADTALYEGEGRRAEPGDHVRAERRRRFRRRLTLLHYRIRGRRNYAFAAGPGAIVTPAAMASRSRSL